MATKKSAIVLKDAKINDMVAAGIEVKLTKMEIADYIAEKAKEELENRRTEINNLIQDYSRNGIPVEMNKKQKAVADAVKVLTAKEITLVAAWENYSGNPRWCGTFSDGERHFLSNVLDENQIPNIDVMALHNEYGECWRRLQELGRKKHRTMLVEQILAGSDSGKKVLSDLANMVQRAVHGDKA